MIEIGLLNKDEKKIFTKNSAGKKLVIVETLPDEASAKPFPAVIMAHGFAYFKEEDGLFTDLAKLLSAKGFAVYRFDFSGCGESEGDYAKTSLTKLVSDLESVRKIVKEKDYVDKDNLSYIGQSFGTNVVIASKLNDAKKIALMGSFYNPYEMLSRIFGDKFKPDGVSTRQSSEGRTTNIEPQFWTDLKKYNLEEDVETYQCPILFVHGNDDQIIPVSSMEPLAKAAKHPVGPIVLPGADHDLNGQRPQAYAKIVEFITGN